MPYMACKRLDARSARAGVALRAVWRQHHAGLTSAVSGNLRPFDQLMKGAVVGVAVAPWARGSQGFEVPGHGKQRVARLLIDAPCGSMTRVTARLDHGHRHPSLAQPARGHLGQGGADAATLRIRIDGQHPGLPDLALWVELGGDEGDDPSRRLSDPDLGCVISEGIANVFLLVLPPVAMQANEDLATQALRQGAEHRRPCPKRQLDNGLLVERPIVADTGVHEYPSLHRVCEDSRSWPGPSWSEVIATACSRLPDLGAVVRRPLATGPGL